jgi:hypothetical protein
MGGIEDLPVQEREPVLRILSFGFRFRIWQTSMPSSPSTVKLRGGSFCHRPISLVTLKARCRSEARNH